MDSDYQRLFVIVWAGFGAVTLAGMAGALIWVWRAGFFKGQEEMRDLALKAATPDDGPAASGDAASGTGAKRI